MNENMMITDPPQICDTYECMNDAHVSLFSAEKGWFRICPPCLDELNRLQAGVMLPEQRGNVTVLHYHNEMPGLRFTASIEAGESEEQR